MKRCATLWLAFAVAGVIGLGAGNAKAQTVIEIGGAGTIGNTILTNSGGTASLPINGGRWSAAGGTGIVYSHLISPSVTIPNSGPVTLAFDHRYFIETAWDGGAVFVSVNGGTATYLPASAFTTNSYTGNTRGNNSSVWTGGEDVFYGKSTGYDTSTMIQSVASLGSLTAGDTVSVEFRGGWDEFYLEDPPNWEIGTVQIVDSATHAALDVDFEADGGAGFRVVNIGSVAGPWTYPKAISRFELDADADTADQYAPDIPGSVIDLNNAVLAVELLNGTLVEGDTFTLFDLSGGTTLSGTYGSLSLPGGSWDVSGLMTTGVIELVQLPATIEEPFAYTPGNLAGKDGGIGFVGPWASRRGNNTVTPMNNFWGNLGTSGNRVNPPGWSYIERPIGTTLSDAGLMANGATLWFSYVMDVLNQNLTNLDFNFALCSEGFYWDGSNNSYGDRTKLASGEGIGVSNWRYQIKGAIWQDNDANTIAEATLADTTLNVTSTGPGSRVLIVGKIEWGATTNDNETLTLYTPDKDRNLGTPILNAWATPPLDQSLFNQISMEWKDSEPSIDEIRFGATSASVLPPDLAPPMLVAKNPVNHEPQASGVYLAGTFDEPISINTGNITITDAAGPTTFTTIPVTDASQVAVSADELSLVITPTAVPEAGHTYYVEIDAGAVRDYASSPFAGIANSSTWRYTVSTIPPTVTSIDSTPAATPVYGLPTVHYTVTFDKYYMDDATVDSGDFSNAGTATIGVGAVTRISDPLDDAVYAFDVTPTSYGTVQLRVSGTIADEAGNALTVPVTDTNFTYFLDAGPEPARQTITLDDSLLYNDGGTVKTFTFDASGSDKLVVIGTGEHNFGGDLSGRVLTVTYDGVSLIKAIEKLPVRSTLQTTSTLWYLDDPGSVHVDGTIVVTVEGNGNNYVEAALGLSGTAPGFEGASAVAVGTPDVDMIVSSPTSFVLSWLTLGGNGNTAASADSVQADSPAGMLTIGGTKTGGNYAGHAVAYSSGLPAANYDFEWNTGLADVLSLAAEFLPTTTGSVLIVR